MMGYTCRTEELPIVEAALAAQGFTVVIPWNRQVGGRAMMMIPAASVLLPQGNDLSLAELRVWGSKPEEVLHILRTLPIALIPALDDDRS